jgi:hypothetical protein
MHMQLPVISLSLIAALALTSCETPMTPGQKALAGAAAGAAAGAIATGHGRGALVGSAIGAGAGYLIGRAQEEHRRDAYYGYGGDYPVGRPAGRYGLVISPYYPHNVIDVRGIPRGEQVLDPSVNRVFINP